MTITTHEFMNRLFAEEEATDRDFVEYIEEIEQDGLLYTHWHDTRADKHYLVRAHRTVHMGFNDSPPEKIEQVREIVEREGTCLASWGVTGRTMHEILAYQLAQVLTEYRFEIDGYTCRISKKA